MFSTALDKILTQLHLDKDKIKYTQFQNRAATSAKRAGMPDVDIKILGRWKSDAYQWYMRMSPSDLARLSQKPISDYHSPGCIYRPQ